MKPGLGNSLLILSGVMGDLSFLLASILEISPNNEEFWFQRHIERSQFPETAREDVLLEQLQLILQELRGDQ